MARSPSRELPIVGIVGAGQLARMLVEAATPLGLAVRVLATHRDESAVTVAPYLLVSPSLEFNAVTEFASGCDVLTFDHELVSPETLRMLEGAGHVLRPNASAELLAQDKLHQREVLSASDFPVPDFSSAQSFNDIVGFAETHAWPVVVKAARGGYDGRGVWVLPDRRAAASFWAQTVEAGQGMLVERFVAVDREFAVLVARRPSGEAVTYPITGTVQANGICQELVVPCELPLSVAVQASGLALRLADQIDAVGILAVEFFLAPEGLLVNEVALRPHNSGHWTIEGARTSQFENHLRAVLDWPLGITDLVSPAVVTVNVTGRSARVEMHQALPLALAVPGIRVHLYDKAQRPGRKLGHVTAVGEDLDETRERAWQAANLLMTGAI